jgi:protein-S-isoprenylcysteine O-methyltransferase Ste14
VDIFLPMAGLIWIFFWFYWLISAWVTRSPTKRRQSRLSWIFIALVCGFLIFYSSATASGFWIQRAIPGNLVIGMSGLILTLLGVGFAVWARVYLGKNWSSMPAIKVDHKLIRTGPYSLVRHPIYTGILFGIAGTAIIIGEPVGLIAFLLILVISLWKIQMEEKYLQEEFGEDYTRYKKEVPALIPFV